ncbi:MAG: hypothetical protein ABSA66_15700 [Roseiarcus sp.]|jgi:hypothetical protein
MKYLWLANLYREIAEGAGLDAALGLARARGGLRISVPRNPRAAPWLAEAMGEKGAAILCDLYGGELIDLPADPVSGSGQNARVRRIRQAIREGALSANEIARMAGVTRRAVFINKARMRELAPEPDLLAPLCKAENRR